VLFSSSWLFGRHSEGEIYIGGKMYVAHSRCMCLLVCLSVCSSPHSHATARTDVTWGNGRGAI